MNRGRMKSLGPTVLRRSALALAVLLFAPASAQAGTFTVTKTGDTNDGVCDADCSLREAIIVSNASGVANEILLAPGTYTLSIGGAGEDAGATGDLDIDGEPATIRGTGATPAATEINATGLGDRILDVIDFNDARVLNLTMRGGAATTGGAIRTSDQVTVRDVTFAANSAATSGGAIHLDDDLARATIEDSTFNGNSATNGGAIYNESAATAVVARSTFSGNTVGGRGAAIYNQNDAAFTLDDSTVTGGAAADDGGAIFTQNTSSFTIGRSVLTGNRAGSAGGAIFVQNDSALTISETTIAGNTALGITASDGGGAIYANNDSAVLIERSTISGNRSEGDAGAISRNNNGQLLMNNSTVSGNSAAGNGGGLVLDSAGGAGFVALENTTIAGNSAGALGGGIYNEGDPALEAGLQRTIVAGNTAAGGTSDCSTDGLAQFDSRGFNLDGSGTCGLGAGGDVVGAAALAPLASNGGPTQTHALLPGSAAIDTGGSGCPPIDQRTASRPQGAACDIGAFESSPDVTGPTVKIGGAKKQKVGKLAVTVSCDEACTATLRGKITLKGEDGKKSFKLAPRTADVGAGEDESLKLKPKGKKGKKKLKRAAKDARAGTATIEATAKDAAGNEGQDERKVELKV